eukprot:scaffold18.g1936.t1
MMEALGRAQGVYEVLERRIGEMVELLRSGEELSRRCQTALGGAAAAADRSVERQLPEASHAAVPGDASAGECSAGSDAEASLSLAQRLSQMQRRRGQEGQRLPAAGAGPSAPVGPAAAAAAAAAEADAVAAAEADAAPPAEQHMEQLQHPEQVQQQGFSMRGAIDGQAAPQEAAEAEGPEALARATSDSDDEPLAIRRLRLRQPAPASRKRAGEECNRRQQQQQQQQQLLQQHKRPWQQSALQHQEQEGLLSKQHRQQDWQQQQEASEQSRSPTPEMVFAREIGTPCAEATPAAVEAEAEREGGPSFTPLPAADVEAAPLFSEGHKGFVFVPPHRLRHLTSQAAIQRKAKELLKEAEQATAADREKQNEAWKSAAMAWRQKNKPSDEVLKAAKKAEAARVARATAAARGRKPGYVPVGAYVDHAANGTPMGEPPPTARGARRRARARGGSGAGKQERAPAVQPDEEAPEADWRAYHRSVAQDKVARATTFEQVLRAFGVPCDPGRLKDAYRQATRMYHPDSNSSARLWQTPADKVEAEEVMKIINERKPADL